MAHTPCVLTNKLWVILRGKTPMHAHCSDLATPLCVDAAEGLEALIWGEDEAME